MECRNADTLNYISLKCNIFGILYQLSKIFLLLLLFVYGGLQAKLS